MFRSHNPKTSAFAPYRSTLLPQASTTTTVSQAIAPSLPSQPAIAPTASSSSAAIQESTVISAPADLSEASSSPKTQKKGKKRPPSEQSDTQVTDAPKKRKTAPFIRYTYQDPQGKIKPHRLPIMYHLKKPTLVDIYSDSEKEELFIRITTESFQNCAHPKYVNKKINEFEKGHVKERVFKTGEKIFYLSLIRLPQLMANPKFGSNVNSSPVKFAIKQINEAYQKFPFKLGSTISQPMPAAVVASSTLTPASSSAAALNTSTTSRHPFAALSSSMTKKGDELIVGLSRSLAGSPPPGVVEIYCNQERELAIRINDYFTNWKPSDPVGPSNLISFLNPYADGKKLIVHDGTDHYLLLDPLLEKLKFIRVGITRSDISDMKALLLPLIAAYDNYKAKLSRQISLSTSGSAAAESFSVAHNRYSFTASSAAAAVENATASERPSSDLPSV